MPTTYFITGGCGFIGSNFIRTLHRTQPDAVIINLDKLTYAGNPASLKDLAESDRYHFVKGDINKSNLVRKIFTEHEPDVLVHFAAESHVDRSITGPRDFIDTNILGTMTLLQESLMYFRALSEEKRSGFRFHHVSTDEVFGSLTGDGYFTEETPYDPSSPYSASKASSDHLVRAWHRTYGLPVLITNCSNNYGPYQFPEKLIPLMILNCLAGKSLPVYGDGQNVRDWLYVEDHCSAILEVIHRGAIGETYNIGGNNEIKNIQIVEIICDILDEIRPSTDRKSYRQLITFVNDRPGHDFRYAIDAGKIQRQLGWFPAHTFESAIRKTIEWYLENQEWWEPILSGEYQDYYAAHYEH